MGLRGVEREKGERNRQPGKRGPIVRADRRAAMRLREGVKIGCSNGITYVDFVCKYLHRPGIWKVVLLAVDRILTRCKLNGEKLCIT